MAIEGWIARRAVRLVFLVARSECRVQAWGLFALFLGCDHSQKAYRACRAQQERKRHWAAAQGAGTPWVPVTPITHLSGPLLSAIFQARNRWLGAGYRLEALENALRLLCVTLSIADRSRVLPASVNELVDTLEFITRPSNAGFQ